MISAPKDLYTKDVTSHIQYLIEDYNVKYFDDIDDVNQTKLISMGIKALGYDIEIIIGTKANKHLAVCLLHGDRDDQIELFKSIQESANEYFASYYDFMIDEMRETLRCDELFGAGFRPYEDSQTGEILWRKSA